MSIARWGMGVALAAFAAGVAFADDVTNLKSEVADLKAKVAAMESAQMAPAAGGDAESLTSMKKKGAIKIGGEVQVAMQVIDREDQSVNTSLGGVDPNRDQGDEDYVQSTVFTTTEANLDLQVNASKDVFLFLRLDLDDFWTDDANNVEQDDFLEEVYFMWKNVRGLPWDIWFGKKEAPFGMNKDPLILEQVTNRKDGKMSSYLGQAWEAADSTLGIDVDGDGVPEINTNPHNVLGDYAHPGAFDNVFQVGTSWKWKDLVKAEIAVFQSKADNLSTGQGAMTRGMHEDRSDDTMFFQSVAGRLTVTPIENLTIVLSAMNEHCDSAGDADLMTTAANRITAATLAQNFGAEFEDNDGDGINDNNDAEDDRQAVSLGVNYKFKPIPLEMWAEYLHGWNWAWNDEYDADVFVLGAKYGLTEAIDLYLIGDWVGIDDDRFDANQQDEDYYRLAAAIQYTFDNGIILSLEYAHEWYDLEEEASVRTNGALLRQEGAEADVVIFGTIWKF